jgi:pilus assembly protein CpaB
MLSLIFGGSAALGVNRYVANKTLAAIPQADSVPVVVAVTSIPRGASLTADLVKTRDYPKAMLPDGALIKVADALERTVFVPLVKDELILDSKLAPKGAKRGMAALIPDGLRAFTIHTPSVASGVGGFILPGNKVDILLTIEGKRGSITTTLLQNLEILAVDQRIDAPADNRVDPNQLRSVTLLVTPDQAARLSLGQNKGALCLSLRNHKDERIASTTPARWAELDDKDREEPPAKVVPEPAPPPLPPPPARVVTIYRGIRGVERSRLGEVSEGFLDSISGRDEPRVVEPR